jgi:hypothetical protein
MHGMTRKQLHLRVPAIMVAVLLMVGYVYTRSGGQLPGMAKPAPAAPQPGPLPGSKSMAVFRGSEPPLEPAIQKALIYGSKSAPVFVPEQPEPGDTSVPETTVTPVTDPNLLPGSKSAAIVVPWPESK